MSLSVGNEIKSALAWTFMKGVMEIPVIIGLVCLNQSSMFKLNCKVWLCIHQGVNFSANDLGGPHPASWTELRVLWDSLCVSSMSFLLEFLAYFFLLWLPVGLKKKKTTHKTAVSWAMKR